MNRPASRHWETDKKPPLSSLSDSVSKTGDKIEETEKNHSSKTDVFRRGEKWVISEKSVVEFSLIFNRTVQRKKKKVKKIIKKIVKPAYVR